MIEVKKIKNKNNNQIDINVEEDKMKKVNHANEQKQQLSLKQGMSAYEQSDWKASTWQIINSIVPFIVLWFLAYQSLSVSYWLTLALAALAAGFLVRTFILFHDCCHHSFFRSQKANELLGTLTGILTFHPFHKWRHHHVKHHATSGKLGKQSGEGEIWLLTVEEYLAASKWKRLAYRLYRNPLVMFGLGPIYVMLIENRFNRRRARSKERMNTYITNVGIIALAGGLCWAIGWEAFLLVQVPVFYISSAAGIWLFYVQHQFEDSYFAREEDWDYVKAAVDGSSYYQLPKVLQFLSGNIGFHHVHHLSPKVPNYHLEKAHVSTPALRDVTTVTIKSSLRALRFKLWDEHNHRFVSFRELSNKPIPR